MAEQATGWLQPVTLSGDHVRLEPLSMAHHDDLVVATQDGELWKLWYTTVPDAAGMRSEIERRLRLQQEGSMLPFAVIDPRTGNAVGMTTYMNVDAVEHRVEIGSTWYRKAVQRTALNTECKLLLLTHAFETLECIAVEFRTSSFNLQSRTAIERIGAKLDGVLRHHARHANGTFRDTYVYSIIAEEWSGIRSELKRRLDQ
jgi:RimJ/RimL family protein N-acetyltransferase